ncbi:MAG: hypothetical protein ACOYK8_00165 [Alphaproteobacteria bacterium]
MQFFKPTITVTTAVTTLSFITISSIFNVSSAGQAQDLSSANLISQSNTSAKIRPAIHPFLPACPVGNKYEEIPGSNGRTTNNREQDKHHCSYPTIDSEEIRTRKLPQKKPQRNF